MAYVQDKVSSTEPLSCQLASGTKQYLAPEVFTKAHLHGPESDFWSLTVVAYEMLFGKRPFEKHCPVVFISYLEKGYKAKIQKDKDTKLNKMHFLSGFTSIATSIAASDSSPSTPVAMQSGSGSSGSPSPYRSSTPSKTGLSPYTPLYTLIHP